MKTLVHFVLVCMIMSVLGCANSRLVNGDYDTALRIAVKKLKRNPDKMKYINILEEAYVNANTQDENRITFLKKEGRPDVWDEIFERYSALKRRQELVQGLPFTPKAITFKDYDNDVINAKKNAAEYFYAHGEKKMNEGGRGNARIAYDNFLKVKSYYSDYKDVDQKISNARFEGTSNALFVINNASGIKLPPNFEAEIKRMTVEDLSSEWVNFDLNEQEGLNYHYNINLKMQVLNVSPNLPKEIIYTDSKEIKDGWEYVLDDKGNVMKDSLGNDIKKPKFKIITAKVTERQMRKTARISGIIEFIDLETNQVMESSPIAADSFFEHRWGTAQGDLRALSDTSRKLIKIKPLPFPADPDLIMDASITLRNMTKDILRSKRRLLF
ncbi:MAG: hypothetical protein MRY83_22415 [Flavobacteriales bacterium]|nr:hypothetical protein [Flavobacteriales bacterium]